MKALVLVAATAAMAQSIPEFVHGEECLFCHRNDIGSAWQKNRHNNTTRRKDGGEEFVLGAGAHTRRLKKAGYQRLAIWDDKTQSWDGAKFGERCAGCHTTAVDPKDLTYAYTGLDCFTCHGTVDLQHSGNTQLVLLSKKRRGDVALVNSICSQCHLRGAKSKATGRPYPNAYVAGSSLFDDFQADLKLADQADLNPGDRHVYRSVRDGIACLGCHAVHANSNTKHRRVLNSPVCQDCHFEGRPRKEVRKYEVSSALCEY